MSNLSAYQLWCLASLFKTKTVSRIHNYLLGHVNEVERIEDTSQIGYVQFVCDHIQNLLKHPNHIIDHIYLGSGIHAMNRGILDQFEIQGILNVTQELPQYFTDSDFSYLQLPVRDTRDAFLLNHYEKAFQFFEDCQKNQKNVLVHCYMGSSRSASTIIYYMIRKHGYQFDEAFQYLKERRPHVNLNTNFEQELRQFERLNRQQFGDSELVEMAEPVELAEPAEIAELSEPVELAEPVEPAEPTEPAEPVELAEPVEIAEPVEPAELAEPVELAEPAEPVELAEPSEPSKKCTLDEQFIQDVVHDVIDTALQKVAAIEHP